MQHPLAEVVGATKQRMLGAVADREEVLGLETVALQRLVKETGAEMTQQETKDQAAVVLEVRVLTMAVTPEVV